MTHGRAILERQLQEAKERLKSRVNTLTEKGVTPKERRRDPIWRALHADCTRLEARLRQVSEIELLNEDAERRKAEKPSREERTKPKKESKKESKEKSKKQGSKQKDQAGQKKPKQQKSKQKQKK